MMKKEIAGKVSMLTVIATIALSNGFSGKVDENTLKTLLNAENKIIIKDLHAEAN